MKKIILLLFSFLVTFNALSAIKIDADIIRSSDHSKVWTPPVASTTLIGVDTTDDLTNKTVDTLNVTAEQVNGAPTGSNALVSLPSSSVIQLTNASLVSIDGIVAPTKNQIIVLKNKTGVDITINNELAGNTSYRIRTGTGANIVMKNDSALVLSYSTIDNRWQVVGGSGSGGGSSLSDWSTAKSYIVGDIAIESNKIYKCLIAHTSGTFATDLAASKWVELSANDLSSATGVLSIVNGGTGSATQNFVDLTNNQTIAGTKTFSNTISGSINGNAATVTTNANLTGPITSVGNTTSIASQTGTGTKIVVDTSPTLVTPNIGVASGTSLTTTGNISATGTVTGSNLSGTNTGDLTTKTDSGSAVTTATVVVPNNQLTNTATNTYRLENDSSNLLINPSFEHLTFSTGWTTSIGTSAINTTNFTEGLKSFKLTSTASGANASQTSTLNAANLKGQQMVASIDVNTNDPLTQACAIVDSVDTNCMYVPITSTTIPFRNVVIPFIAGGTNNGIRIKSATTTSGLITYLDNAKVGQGLPLQNVSGAKLMGSVTISGCTSGFNLTSATFTDFEANTNCVYTTTGNAVADTSFGTTQIPSIKFASLPAGEYLINVEGSFYQSNTNQNGYLRISDGSNISRETSEILSSAGGIIVPSISHSMSYSTSQSNVTLKLQGASTSSNLTVYAGGTIGNSNGANSRHLTFKVYYYPPDSKIYSTASPDYAYTNAGAITIGATTTAPTKGTIVTDRIMASRNGQNLIAEYQYGQSSAGSAGSGDYLFTLPSGLSFDTNIILPFSGTIFSSAQAHAKAIVGYGSLSDSGNFTSICKLFAYDSTRFRAFCEGGSSQSGAISGYMFNPSNLTFTSAMLSFGFRLQAPIAGWQDYGLIVGSFAGIEKCANDYECTDTFTAKITSAAAVTNQNIRWISSASYSSGAYTITLNTNLKDGINPLISNLNCVASTNDSSNQIPTAEIASITTTGFTVITRNNAGAGTNFPFTIKCQKGTNDYKPKTAKVATSIGVPTVPNSGTKAYDIISFSYAQNSSLNSNCSTSSCYVDQNGTSPNISMTRTSSGNYVLNLPRTYSNFRCTASGYLIGNGPLTLDAGIGSCKSCSSFPFTTKYNGSANDSVGTFNCVGEY